MAVFGTPQSLISDNGGEFNNELLRDVAELLDTRVAATAGYSPWSNGIVERHNAVIANMILKIVSDSSCSISNALVWAVSAKNALSNNKGYSPNQLVFGRNPNLPSVLTSKPPALRTHTPSKLIAEHLNAIHLARQSFIESESSNKLKVALQKHLKTPICSKEFANGDHVYYRRPDSKELHGPGVVIGSNGKIVWVQHGGSLLRVSPVHLFKDNTPHNSNKYDDFQSNNSTLKRSDENNNTAVRSRRPSSRAKDCTSENIAIVMDIDDISLFNAENVDAETVDAENADINTVEIETQSDIEPEHTDDNHAAVSTTDPIISVAAAVDDVSVDVSPNIDMNIVSESETLDMIAVAEPSSDLSLLAELDSPATETLIGTTNVEDIIDNVVPSDISNSNKVPSNDSRILLPKVDDYVRYVDPDTQQEEIVHIFKPAGKASCGNRNWRNVRNMVTGTKKSVDFSKVKWWPLEQETIYSAKDSTAVKEAQLDELKRWNDYSVYEEVEDEGQPAISLRWVITQKTVENDQIVKARLVARGFEEDTSDIRTDSPTVSKENIRLMSTIAVANNWNVHSIDVRSAFLQGFDIERELFVVPPPEAALDGKLWKLKKTIYGLSDASRAWYLRSSKEIMNQGAIKSKFDNAVFYMRDRDKLLGMICSHVDDFFYNGSQPFHNQVVDHLRDTFSLSQECFDQMLYIGIELKQTENEIIMHQQSYIHTLETVQISNILANRNLDSAEIRQLKGLIGQLQWVAKLSRPDIAFEVCQLSTKVKTATTKELKRANKLVLKLQNEPSSVKIPCIGPITESKLYVYSDASFANLPGSASQGGFVIILVGHNGSPLVWTSHKLKPVVKSSRDTSHAKCFRTCFFTEVVIAGNTWIGKRIYPYHLHC